MTPTTLTGILADPLRTRPTPYHVPPSDDDLCRLLARTEGQPGHVWTEGGRWHQYPADCRRCEDGALTEYDKQLRSHEGSGWA